MKTFIVPGAMVLACSGAAYGATAHSYDMWLEFTREASAVRYCDKSAATEGYRCPEKPQPGNSLRPVLPLEGIALGSALRFTARFEDHGLAGGYRGVDGLTGGSEDCRLGPITCSGWSMADVTIGPDTIDFFNESAPHIHIRGNTAVGSEIRFNWWLYSYADWNEEYELYLPTGSYSAYFTVIDSPASFAPTPVPTPLPAPALFLLTGLAGLGLARGYARA